MKYIIAIDGGGTKTKAYLGNDRGEILGVAESGPSNYHSIGVTGTRDSLNHVIQTLCCSSNICGNDIDVISLGLAGMGRHEDRAVIEGLLSDIGVGRSRILNSDAITALTGAHGRKAGAVTICGTGSICIGIGKDGRVVRAGGWGHIIGDEGSGYDIGIKSLRAVVRSYDKRGKKTILTEKVLKYYGIDSPEDLIKYVYNGSSKDIIAGLAILTAEAAFEGDETAKRIMEEAVCALVEMTEAVINGLYSENDRISLSLTGGIFTNIGFVAEEFALRLRNRIGKIDIYPPEFDSAIGAMIVAWGKMGVSYDKNDLKKQVKDVNLYGCGNFDKNQAGV